MHPHNPSRNEVLLRFTDLSVGHGAQPVLTGVSGELRRGQMLFVVGPNGSGKTTLLKTLAGIIPPLGGRIEPGPVTHTLSYMPQVPELDPAVPITAAEVVALGLRHGRAFPSPLNGTNRGKVMTALQMLGLEHIASAQFRLLSGGQKRRVLIARAMVTYPDLLIIDEPASGLDPQAAAELVSILDRLRATHGLAVVCSAHDPQSAQNLQCTIMLLANGTAQYLNGTRTSPVNAPVPTGQTPSSSDVRARASEQQNHDKNLQPQPTGSLLDHGAGGIRTNAA